ncbi:hypothetical protein JST97_37050 [bacterium]|nr:hypothetical protein [bacterium]
MKIRDLLLSWLFLPGMALASPELVVGVKDNLTTVHLSPGQNLTVQIEPILKNDPIPGRKWTYLAPTNLGKPLKFLGESQRGRLQIFRFQCQSEGRDILSMPLCTKKDGRWDGLVNSYKLEVICP